jgi:hypothetical protein
MELDVALLKKDMDYLKSEVGEIKQLIKDHIHEEETRYQAIMDSKADKWTEKAIIWAIAGIVTAAAGLVWYTVTKQIL